MPLPRITRRPHWSVWLLLTVLVAAAIVHFSLGFISPLAWRYSAWAAVISSLGAVALDRYHRMHGR